MENTSYYSISTDKDKIIVIKPDGGPYLGAGCTMGGDLIELDEFVSHQRDKWNVFRIVAKAYRK